MTVQEAKPRVLACLRHGVDTIEGMRQILGCSFNTAKHAVRDLQREKRVLAVSVGVGYQYRLRKAVEEEEGPIALASSPHFLARGTITRDRSLYPGMEEAAYRAVRRLGRARAPRIAEITGLSYHDAHGALWRLVAQARLRVVEPDGEHAIFHLKG